MKKQRIYYPRTTLSQRQLLFQVWEETQDVAEACQRARVSESTYHYWKARFESEGYEGLKRVKKTGPARGIQVAESTQEKVVAMKQAHPEWGKRRIADELAKANSWVPLVSVNAVRRILVENGLWPEGGNEEKKTDSNR